MNERRARTASGEGEAAGVSNAAGSREERWRLFVGVPLPAELLPLVQRAQRGIGSVPGLRLTTAEQLHVTLAFIGEVGQDKVQAAARVVSHIPARLGGVVPLGGYLALPSNSRARVVALGLDDRTGLMARLYEAVMSGLEGEQVMRREKRPFRAHLTIARLRVPTRVQPKYECEPAAYAVSSVCLYRSELRRSGAVYTVVMRRALSVD